MSGGRPKIDIMRVNPHGTDFGASQVVSEPGSETLRLFRYNWLSKQRVRKACRITSLTVVVVVCQKILWLKLFLEISQ